MLRIHIVIIYCNRNEFHRNNRNNNCNNFIVMKKLINYQKCSKQQYYIMYIFFHVFRLIHISLYVNCAISINKISFDRVSIEIC